MTKFELIPKQPRMKERLIGAFQGIILCIVAMPVALVVTILLMPLWSSLESSMSVEAVGHSGPAEWCYLFVYVVVMAFAGFVWSRLERRKENR